MNKTSLRELLALLNLADCAVTVNSSTLIMASSLETPQVSLFGAFNHKIRTKYYDRCTVISGEACKTKCEQHWTECPLGHPSPCMRDIKPELVAQIVEQTISKFPRDLEGRGAIE